jgi:hypothetical protein
MLWLAEVSPHIIIKDISKEYVDSENQIKIKVVIENEGYLPTYITQRALDAQIAAPIRVTVDLADAELLDGEKRQAIGFLKGFRDLQGQSGTAELSSTLEYTVSITGPQPIFSIRVDSEKGGVKHNQINL